MKKITLGILGAGRIGKLHTENILLNFPDIQIKGIADPYFEEAWDSNKPVTYFP